MLPWGSLSLFFSSNSYDIVAPGTVEAVSTAVETASVFPVMVSINLMMVSSIPEMVTGFVLTVTGYSIVSFPGVPIASMRIVFVIK